jgi:hypothetical protein
MAVNQVLNTLKLSYQVSRYGMSTTTFYGTPLTTAARENLVLDSVFTDHDGLPVRPRTLTHAGQSQLSLR